MCAALVALLDILLAAGRAAVLLLPGRQQLFALGIIFLYETRCASQRSNHRNHTTAVVHPRCLHTERYTVYHVYHV